MGKKILRLCVECDGCRFRDDAPIGDDGDNSGGGGDLTLSDTVPCFASGAGGCRIIAKGVYDGRVLCLVREREFRLFELGDRLGGRDFNESE